MYRRNEIEETRLLYAIIMAIVICIIGLINNIHAQTPINTKKLSTTTSIQRGSDAQQQTKIASASSKIRCYSHEKLVEQIAKNPALQNELDLQEQNTNNWILKNVSKKQNSIITIPVVVHVLYNTSTENISYTQIQSQLDVLNQDFRKLNANAVNVPSAFSSYAADAQIEFCLASTDENGNATSGITRTSTSTTSFPYNEDMKYTSSGGIDAWPTDQYLNIWVCNLGSSLLGYAQFPGTGNYETDGVVINYIAFGTTGTVVAPYHLGRTATHEIGHWLNLRHIWGDDSGACTGTDYVTDTPDQANYTYGCPSFPYTDACSTTSPGIMFMNYMDYADDDCANMFTSGQVSRMLATLNTTRASLLTSKGCSSSTSSSLTADFTANTTAIYAGESITFYDASSGSPNQWNWSFSNAQPYSSSLQNPTVTYYVAGNYEVSLSVSKGSTTDSISKTAYITVYPQTTLSCDTLSNVDLNNDSITLYKSSGGFISGHNSYGDLSFADYFYAYPSGSSISSVMLAFGYAKYASSTSKLKVKVWDNTGSSGAPGNELYSQDVLLSSIYNDVLNSYYTVVNFSSPVQITTNFYVGIEITYSAGDTVVLYTNTMYTASPATAWNKRSDNTWHAFSDQDNWGINSSFLIRPVLCQQEIDADFTANSSTIKAGETVTFQDLSTGSPTSWFWAFSNGSPSGSSLQNPSVTFYNPGVYKVYLWASNSIGTDTAVRQITVQPNTDDECFALSNYDFNNDQPVLYYMPGSSGYLSGNNGFLDRAKADYFYTYPSGKELSGVYLYFLRADYSSASSKIKIKVWDNSGIDGSPGIELASEDVYISSIATDISNGDYTGVAFSSPVNITTPFYVGVELPTQAGDTVALLSNTTASAHPGTGWEQWYDESWHSYSEVYTYELTNLIVPVMCNSSTVSVAPTADFAASSTLINVGDTVNFTDLSSGSPNSWQWSFTGANTTSSTVANPSGIIYNTVGTYSVSLIASNFNGSNTLTKTNYITVVSATTTIVSADFTSDTTTVTSGSTVQFYDASSGTPTAWKWSFSGGSPSSSTKQNPNKVTFSTPGTYTISLTASNTNGSDVETKVNYITVLPGANYVVNTNFLANSTSIVSGNSIAFTDLSSGNPTNWQWSFDGGSPSMSSDQNPTAILYNTPGTYAVTLIAYNSYTWDVETKTAYITVKGDTVVPVNTNFSASNTTIVSGQSIDFTDLSTGDPTSWAWTFVGGSPSSSSDQNPSGISYSTAGKYAVVLTSLNLNSFDTESKTEYITVLESNFYYCDTISNVDEGADAESILSLGSSGYISGTNAYGDMAKADVFVLDTSAVLLSGLKIKFGKASYSSSTSTVKVCLWDNTGSKGTPGNIIASKDVLISTISKDISNQAYTYVNFSPVVLTTTYYAGIQLPTTAGDTIAIIHNDDGETSPGTAWEQWNNGSWYNYSFRWGRDIAHYIMPMVCSNEYINPITAISETQNENTILVYPNPASDEIFIEDVSGKNITNIILYDVVGKKVNTIHFLKENNFSGKILLGNLSGGVYMLQVQDSFNNSQMKRIVLR